MKRALALLSTAAILVVAADRAQAQPKPLKAKVVSVRKNRVYLQLEEEANLVQGQKIVVARGGKSATVRLVASSSRFLLISRPKKLALKADQTVTVRAKAEAPATPLVKAGPARRIGGSISIGRRAPTLQQFRAQAPPRRKLFNFDGTVEEDAGDDDDDEPKTGSRPANEVRGSLEVGAVLNEQKAGVIGFPRRGGFRFIELKRFIGANDNCGDDHGTQPPTKEAPGESLLTALLVGGSSR